MTDRPDVTAVTVTPLSPNTSYTVNVTAVNAIGEGQGSQTVMVITEPQGWWNIRTTHSTVLYILYSFFEALHRIHVHTVQGTISNYVHYFSFLSKADVVTKYHLFKICALEQ